MVEWRVGEWKRDSFQTQKPMDVVFRIRPFGKEGPGLGRRSFNDYLGLGLGLLHPLLLS